MQGSVSHPWLKQVEHSGKEFVSLRVRSSVGFPPGRRETSLGPAGAKAIATVLLFGGRADPVGSRGRGAAEAGAPRGGMSQRFRARTSAKRGHPRGFTRGRPVPNGVPSSGRTGQSREREGWEFGWVPQSCPAPQRDVSEACALRLPVLSSLENWSLSPSFGN